MSDLINLQQPGFSLVLGGQRSGKSVFAERIIEEASDGFYIATSESRDDEMTARINQHQERRGSAWQTIEEPISVKEILLSLKGQNKPTLVDCLTLWLSNLMAQNMNIDDEINNLCAIANEIDYPVIFVSNEVGQGIIPDNKLARRYADFSGVMNQKIAAVSNSVVFVTAGLPQKLK